MRIKDTCDGERREKWNGVLEKNGGREGERERERNGVCWEEPTVKWGEKAGRERREVIKGIKKIRAQFWFFLTIIIIIIITNNY